MSKSFNVTSIRYVENTKEGAQFLCSFVITFLTTYYSVVAFCNYEINSPKLLLHFTMLFIILQIDALFCLLYAPYKFILIIGQMPFM